MKEDEQHQEEDRKTRCLRSDAVKTTGDVTSGADVKVTGHRRRPKFTNGNPTRAHQRAQMEGVPQ